MKPNLHRCRLGERISTTRTAGRDAPSAPQRQTTIGYDAATGRIATMLANGSNVPFTWSYLPGSDLKSSLAYPNGLVASWQYDANGQLVQTSNVFSTNVISQYNYVYDAAGSRISCLKTGSAFAQSGRCFYEYNARSELINAFSDVDDDYCYSYGFDGIGNRNAIAESGTNSVYMANQLNQYVLIDDFVPVFDDDGNQTFIRTYTGSWAVIFNGENRPASWCSGETNVIMSFDRMGRRVSNNGSNFSYDGYVQIADSDRNLYIWDRTDTVATRPLVWRHGGETYYYSFDDKNVSEVFDMRGNVVAHYEYAPFGHSTRTDGELALDNKFRYSSEYSDDELDLIYYNYRHYDPHPGRWCARDPLLELASANLYTFCANIFSGIDVLGRSQLLDFLNDVEYSFGRKLSMVEEVVENALDNVYNNVNLVLELIVDGSYRLGKRTAESTIEASKVLWKLVSNTAAQLNKKLDDKFGFCGSGFTAVIVPNKFPGMRASFSARELTVVFAFTVVDFNKCCKDHDDCYTAGCKEMQCFIGDANARRERKRQLQNGCDDTLSRCMKDKASEALGGWSAPVGFLGNVYKGALWLVGGIAFDFACPEKMTNDK